MNKNESKNGKVNGVPHSIHHRSDPKVFRTVERKREIDRRELLLLFQEHEAKTHAMITSLEKKMLQEGYERKNDDVRLQKAINTLQLVLEQQKNQFLGMFNQVQNQFGQVQVQFGQINNKFGEVWNQIDLLGNKIELGLELVNGRINGLEDKVDLGFDKIRLEIGQVYQNIAQLDFKIDSEVQGIYTEMDKRDMRNKEQLNDFKFKLQATEHEINKTNYEVNKARKEIIEVQVEAAQAFQGQEKERQLDQERMKVMKQQTDIKIRNSELMIEKMQQETRGLFMQMKQLHEKSEQALELEELKKKQIMRERMHKVDLMEGRVKEAQLKLVNNKLRDENSRYKKAEIEEQKAISLAEKQRKEIERQAKEVERQKREQEREARRHQKQIDATWKAEEKAMSNRYSSWLAYRQSDAFKKRRI